MNPIDKKDIILLNELLKDGRITYSELAEKVDLSVPAVIARVEKLIKKKIIENFTIDIDYSLITQGSNNIILLRVIFDNIDGIAQELNTHKFMKKVYLTTGEYNIVVHTHNLIDSQKKSLIDWLKQQAYIEKMNILHVYDYLKEDKAMEISEPNNVKLICDYCKREFSGDVFTKIINKRKRYFCCNTCLSEYEKIFSEK